MRFWKVHDVVRTREILEVFLHSSIRRHGVIITDKDNFTLYITTSSRRLNQKLYDDIKHSILPKNNIWFYS
jgi:DNA-binding cell septation regulator SpoVG